MSDFCPDLSALHDALFETDDDGESHLIYDLISHFEKYSSWPRDFYKSGDAIHWLGEYALTALGQVVKEYDDVMEGRRLEAEYSRRYPIHQPPPSPPAAQQQGTDVKEDVEIEVVEVKTEPQENYVVDLVSEDVCCGVGAEVGGEEVVMKDQTCTPATGSLNRKVRGPKKKWVPSVIVLALPTDDVVPVVQSKGEEVVVADRKSKGKEKVVDDGGRTRRRSRRKAVEGVERLNLGGSERRSRHGVPLDEPKLVNDFPGYKLHDILIEDDEKGWQKFKVVEEYDSGCDSGGPDIPMSPPSPDKKLDPDEHIFLLVKKEPCSSP